MPRKAPAWWYDGSRLMPALLSPASLIWRLGARLRFTLASPYRSTLPVVCVGNLTAGGAGKTPAAIAIGHMLQQLGARPVYLTRGYGGHKTGPHLVDPERDSARDVGDEPLLLAKVAPVIVAADRAKGARLAEQTEADVIVMDDGFQNPTLEKTCSLLVVDRATGIGNARVMPAGPLRAPLHGQLRRAHAIVAVGKGQAADSVLTLARDKGLTIFDAEVVAKTAAPWLADAPVVAFAGIANPDKFFATLEELGANLAARVSFADHHPLSRADAEKLMLQAKEGRAQLVTTEKDHARLAARSDLELLRQNVKVLPVRLQFRDRGKLKRLLSRVLKSG